MKRQIIGLAVAAALFGAGNVHAFLIDDFNNSNAANTGTNTGGDCLAVSQFNVSGQCVVAGPSVPAKFGTDTDTLLPYTGISGTVGNTRDVSIAVISGAGPTDGGADRNGTGILEFNTPIQTASKFTTIYDGDDTNSPTVLGNKLGDIGKGVDLTDGGVSTLIAWDIVPGGLDINVRVTVILIDDDGTTAGNAFLKIPFTPPPTLQNPLPDACNPAVMVFAGVFGNPIVCVDGDNGGTLVHFLASFNAGGTDPASGASFFDDPFNPLVDMDLAPSDGPNSLDLTNIRGIKVIYDTALNSGAGSLDLGEDMLYTTAIPEPGTILLLGTGLLALGLSGASRRFKRRK